MRRAFKYRWYPTSEQAALLTRTFGCVRYVWNRALAERTDAWRQGQQHTSYEDTSAWLTRWKRDVETGRLREVSSVPLQQTLRHQQAALRRFFDKKARYPRFKSKRRSKASAEFTRSAFRWRDGRLYLAKLADPLDIVWSRPLPDGAEPSTVTVSRDQVGRWSVSILVDDPTIPDPLPRSNSAVGIDIGLNHLAVLSTGEEVANPRHERRDRQQLAKAQRRLSPICAWIRATFRAAFLRYSDCGWIVHGLPLDVRALVETGTSAREGRESPSFKAERSQDADLC